MIGRLRTGGIAYDVDCPSQNANMLIVISFMNDCIIKLCSEVLAWYYTSILNTTQAYSILYNRPTYYTRTWHTIQQKTTTIRTFSIKR